MAKAHHIFIVGESPLVEEYCALCVAKRQTVAANFTTYTTSRLPKGVRKATRPAKSVSFALELTNTSVEIKKKNLVLLDRALDKSVPIISSSVTVTVAEQATWVRDRQRLMGIGALPSLLGGSLMEFAPSRKTNTQTIARAQQFAALMGKEAAMVHDSIGLVMPRILCMLANEAYFAMMEGVATGEDIDTAMKLGTNHPTGPVERAARIGLRQVFAVLSALHIHSGEDRYRIAPLLRQAALEQRGLVATQK